MATGFIAQPNQIEIGGESPKLDCEKTFNYSGSKQLGESFQLKFCKIHEKNLDLHLNRILILMLRWI